MRSIMESFLIGHSSILSVAVDEPKFLVESKASRIVSNGLTCLGVTIVKESKLSKLQENQPILLPNSHSESDSLLNEIVLNVQQRCKLVDNVFPGKFNTILFIFIFIFIDYVFTLNYFRRIHCKILSKSKGS